jgi:parallel beta-helix repeat protein
MSISKQIAFFLLLFYAFTGTAQQAYVVDQNHRRASDIRGDGTAKRPFKTISRAALVAKAGDTVLVYAGVYRERVAPAHGGERGKPVVYMAPEDQEVFIKGSNVWKNRWNNLDGNKNIYRSPLPLDELQKYNPFFTPLARMRYSRASLGQIFVNSKEYMQVDSLPELLRSPGTWMLSYDSTEVFLHHDGAYHPMTLKNSLVEYSARDKVFAPHIRGLGYITVEGFIIEHCANQFPSGFYHLHGHPQAGALSARSGHNWVIRRNTIRHAKNLGIDCGYEGAFDLEGDQPMPPRETIGFHLIEYNNIDFNGCGGIHGAQQTETVIRRNSFRGNGHLGIAAPENGVIKVHFFYDGLIAENLILDNHCLGIWLDNEWYGTRVTSNTIVNNAGQGIFVEMGEGPCLVDNNIVAYSHANDGIYLHDASGVTIAHNLLFANSHFGIYARIVTERMAKSASGERKIVATRDLNIYNNIFIDNYRGHISLPAEDGDRVRNNRSDYNLFINGTQWQWEGLDFNSFTLGSNDKRISEERLTEVLTEAFDRHNYPDSLRPNMALWKKQPLLRMEWWQLVFGNDLNSFTPLIHTGEIEDGAIQKGEIGFSGSNLRFEIRNGRVFTQFRCPPVEGVDRDFYGNPLEGETVFPGPFQEYKDGFNRFRMKNN